MVIYVHKKCSKKKNTGKNFKPFSLQYQSYVQLVYKDGNYNILPPLFKRIGEPTAFNYRRGYISKEYRMKFGIRCYHCNDFIRFPRREILFFKEFLQREFKEWLNSIHKCWLCFIKKKYPNIEFHPPSIKPYLICDNGNGRHFNQYFFLNGVAIQRPPKRNCVISIPAGFYKVTIDYKYLDINYSKNDNKYMYNMITNIDNRNICKMMRASLNIYIFLQV